MRKQYLTVFRNELTEAELCALTAPPAYIRRDAMLRLCLQRDDLMDYVPATAPIVLRRELPILAVALRTDGSVDRQTLLAACRMYAELLGKMATVLELGYCYN